MSLTHVPVVGTFTYRDADATPAAGEKIHFVAVSAAVVDGEVVTLPKKLICTLNADGEVPAGFTLPTVGDGVYYSVREKFSGGRDDYTIQVLTTDTEIDLATVAPVVPTVDMEAYATQSELAGVQSSVDDAFEHIQTIEANGLSRLMAGAPYTDFGMSYTSTIAVDTQPSGASVLTTASAFYMKTVRDEGVNIFNEDQYEVLARYSDVVGIRNLSPHDSSRFYKLQSSLGPRALSINKQLCDTNSPDTAIAANTINLSPSLIPDPVTGFTAVTLRMPFRTGTLALAEEVATAAQGALADTAVQPAGLTAAAVASDVQAETTTARVYAPADAGKYTRHTNTSAKTATFNTAANLPVGSEYHVANRAASGNLTLNGTIALNAPKGGSLVLAPGDTVTVKVVNSTEADVMGSTVAA